MRASVGTVENGVSAASDPTVLFLIGIRQLRVYHESEILEIYCYLFSIGALGGRDLFMRVFGVDFAMTYLVMYRPMGQ